MKAHLLNRAIADLLETAEYHCGYTAEDWDELWDELGSHWQHRRDAIEERNAEERPTVDDHPSLTAAERNR